MSLTKQVDFICIFGDFKNFCIEYSVFFFFFNRSALSSATFFLFYAYFRLVSWVRFYFYDCRHRNDKIDCKSNKKTKYESKSHLLSRSFDSYRKSLQLREFGFFFYYISNIDDCILKTNVSAISIIPFVRFLLENGNEKDFISYEQYVKWFFMGFFSLLFIF